MSTRSHHRRRSAKSTVSRQVSAVRRSAQRTAKHLRTKTQQLRRELQRTKSQMRTRTQQLQRQVHRQQTRQRE